MKNEAVGNLKISRPLCCFCLFCAWGLAARAGDATEAFPPQAWPENRYDAIKERSPFVLPAFGDNLQSAPVQKNWATDYCISGVVQSGDQSLVLARKISTGERLVIRATENAQGIRLLDLQMSVDPREVSAVLEMGGQKGTIRYDSAVLANLPRSVMPDNPALKPQ